MKYLLFSFFMNCLFTTAMYAQTDTAQAIAPDSAIADGWSSGLKLLSDTANFSFYSIIKKDTVAAVLLIASCNNCYTKSVEGYVIIDFYNHYPMENTRYLDRKKKPFPSGTHVWQYRDRTNLLTDNIKNH